MIRDMVKAAGKKFLGNNYVFTHTARRYVQQGKYLSATLFSLYSWPLRNIIRVKTGYGVSLSFVASKDYYRELHSLLRIDSVEGFGLVRIGRDNDGGYIMLDDFPGGIAYSFGICDDVSWDKDMAERGYDVFMYDHTINGLPESNPRFHWSKLGISNGSSQDERLKTLEELITANGHEEEQDMILKMDVEGAEWGFLERVNPETLAQFSQMTFEIHGVVNPQQTERVLNVLRKINTTHQLIHLHANNNGNYVSAGGKVFSTLFEVSYVLRGKYKFSSDYDVNLPLEIDIPNSNSYPEIPLGHWNRKPEFDGRMSTTTRYKLEALLEG